MAIKLTPQVRTYASGVGAVGERMKVTANKFGIVSEREVTSTDEIKRKKDDYLELLNQFKSQTQTLLGLKAPVLLKVDHEKLLVSFKKYVSATEKAISSLDVENISIDENLLSEAQELQWEASGEIVQISNAMAKKLGI